MRRHVVITLFASAILAAVAVSGCSPSGGGGGATSSTPVNRTPSLGIVSLGNVVPGAGLDFSDSVGAAGTVGSASAQVPALITPTGGTGWQVARVAGATGRAVGAVQVGSTRILVGTKPAGSGDLGAPFAAVSSGGGAWQVGDLSAALPGKLVAVNGVASTGEPNDDQATVVAVGTQVRSTDTTGALPKDPSKRKPFVLLSADQGKSWSATSTLPLPPGVTGGEAFSVTYVSHNTTFEGLVAVGYGWLQKGGDFPHRIGMVWVSPDHGHTWGVVTDKQFNRSGENVEAKLVASQGETVLVLGTVEPAIAGFISPGTVVGAQCVEWLAAADGTWAFGKGPDRQPASLLSEPTAVLPVDGGGYLVATREFGGSAASKFTDFHVNVYASSDGAQWSSVNSQLKGIAAAQRIDGISQFGSRIGLFGLDKATHAQVWVISADQ